MSPKGIVAMNIIKALLFFLLAAGFIFILNTRIGNIPPAGKFLDPFRGFWRNAENKEYEDAGLPVKGLKGKVQVAFDNHMIPHIFAANEYDLYFAQGFLTARDRLWQMDFQTRYAAGRLSEVVGKKALELDRYQRRIGMTYGAENMIKELERHPEIKRCVQAYADGVNAWIRSLNPGDYPIEFKILDYKPEKWDLLNTGLLLKLMSATLAGGSDELYMNNALKKFGLKTVNDLFPDYPFRSDPVIPAGTAWNFKALPVPVQPAGRTGADEYTPVQTSRKKEGIGSNNWAVSGSRTSSGYPLLANDPHLSLTLPSIWYQIQLNGPGINVYGVSIPGAPGVIIGFNQKIAWGVTNVDADVLDFYKIRFNDRTCSKYWYDNKWNKVTRRIETIKVRGGQTERDTVYYTHHGPVVYLSKPAFSKADNIPAGYAMRWIAHDRSADLATFYYLNRARNYQDYRKALSLYTAPAQNFVFASADNDISITANGYFPLKWHDQGKFLLDGSDPANDWHGRIPAEQNPSVKNPPRGFVSSANQPSTDKTYPYYINWEFGGYERARRINQRLSAMQHATADSMRILQNDNYSVFAEEVLPLMLANVNTESLNASERTAFHIMQQWNMTYDAGQTAAGIFEIWQKKLYDLIWADDFTSRSAPMRYPSRDRTVQLLLKEPRSHWYDDTRTTAVETRADLILKSFHFAVDSLERRFGPIGKEWQWANVKQSHVPHLAGIPGLGSGILYNGGSKTSVNALAESHGPSWRMVVALGRNTRGYGILPGGESGNPGSYYYDDMIKTWTRGQLSNLIFLKSPGEKNSHIIQHLTLSKK